VGRKIELTHPNLRVVRSRKSICILIVKCAVAHWDTSFCKRKRSRTSQIEKPGICSMVSESRAATISAAVAPVVGSTPGPPRSCRQVWISSAQPLDAEGAVG
jgi:hypothetical protein